jgi:enoyl-CoA hydratase
MTDEIINRDIRFEVRDRAGVVIFDRPRALNALRLTTIRALRERADAWAIDPAIHHVVVTSSSERAFCAGADVKHLRELGLAHDPSLLDFFFEEYHLDRLIHRYPKPWISLIDGICMGGGIGLSMHTPYRVASEKAVFAMPEVDIGFFPDVAGAHVLARLPGEIGTLLAMTGGRMAAAEAVRSGLVTHPVRSERFPALIEALAETTDAAAVLARFRGDLPGETPLIDRRTTIDRIFSGFDAAEIVARLEKETGDDGDWAHRIAAEIRAKSPTSVALALALTRLARRLDVEGTLLLDWRIVCRILGGTDFYEGVRTRLIDRNDRPRWNPASFAEIAPGAIEAHLTTIPERGDLVFPPLG